MYLDKAKIHIKAGNGGDGTVSFHREKYVMNGGPDGGDGGAGGSIYFVADESQNTLIAFRYQQHYRADNGDAGGKKNQVGKSGKDMIIKVPRGTVIKDFHTGAIIADIYHYGQPVLIMKGGRGGRGNARFATATRQAPAFSENGTKTTERSIYLELMTVADIGLIGFPNVGKSTLLSVVSAARPKIANYHFTTLTPNLGVVAYYDQSFVVADIPGLIEGAADGAGLGHDFLKHINRVRALVHIVDISGTEGRDFIDDYEVIRGELCAYSDELIAKPEVVVANKCDLVEDGKERAEQLSQAIGKPVIAISAATTEGISELVKTLAEMVRELPAPEALQFDPFQWEEVDKTEFFVEKDEDGGFTLSGGLVEELARRVVLSDPESNRYFQRMLREKGVIAELERQGVADGDPVRVLDIEFEFLY